MSENTTLHIHYDTKWGHRISIRGDTEPFSWESGQDAQWHEEHVWIYSWAMREEATAFKILVDDEHWSVGANYWIRKGETKDLYPSFHPHNSHLETIHYFNTPITIYLPPSYEENKLKHYPVLYIHDGQNLFEPDASYNGQIWGIHTTMDDMVEQGLMDEIIAVGIYNRGAGRLYDYTPSYDPDFLGVGAGGGGERYADFLINDIKPHIDTHYRTLPDKSNTGLMGSSLGGLVSLYIGREHPQTFGKVASLSSSFWWNRHQLLRHVIRTREYIPLKIYLDSGTNDSWQETKAMYQALLSCGYVLGQDLLFYIEPHHAHSEVYWGKRIHMPLQFLFPPGRTSYPQ